MRQRNGRILCLLLLLVALRGLIYNLVVPLWQAPDEPGHFEYAALLARLGRPPARSDSDPALQQSIIASLDRTDFWRLTRQARPVPLPRSFVENPFLRRSGSQLGDEPPTYYFVPALICHLGGTIEEQARRIRLYSVSLLVLATWFAWRAARELWIQASEACQVGPVETCLLTVGVPAFYALAPMPTFIGMAINNDSLALATSTGFYWALISYHRRGGLARGLLLAGALGLALLSKRTTLFLLPTALLMVAAGRMACRAWLGLAAAVLMVMFTLAQWSSSAAEAWRTWPGTGLASRSEMAHSGHYALHLTDDSPTTRGEVSQQVSLQELLDPVGAEVKLTAWVRAVDQPTLATIAVADGHGVTPYTFVASTTWQPVSLVHTITTQSGYLQAVISIGKPADPAALGELLVDDVWLASLDSPNNLLRNGDVEGSAHVLEFLLAAVRRFAKLPSGWPQALVTAQSYSAAALQRYGLYMALTFAGFWGNFGWLQLPLPVGVYAVLAVTCGVAALGLLARGRRKNKMDPRIAMSLWQSNALHWLGFSVLLAFIQVFLPMIGRAWQPQGRYLFPALFPLVMFLLLGLGVWVPPRAHKKLLSAWVVGLMLLDSLSLFGTLLPVYR